MNAIVRSVAVAASILIFSGCKEETPAPLPGIGGNMTASFNGQVWVGDNFTLQQPSAGVIDLYATRNSSSDKSVEIHINNYGGLAEYTLGDTGFVNKCVFRELGKTYSTTGGKLTMTVDDGTNIEGTFYFTAVSGSSTMQVTSGKFTYRKK